MTATKPYFLKHCASGIVFGCEQLGRYEWGGVDIAEIEHAISAAVYAGVKVFDTADCYGPGHSEERLGRVLRGHRNEVIIATKYAVKLHPDGVQYDSSPKWAREALEASLKRLNTDYVDHYQMHYWDGETDLDDVIHQFEKFVEEGKIRSYGLTNVNALPEKFIGNQNFQTMSLEFSLANRANEKQARQFGASNLCFLSYGSLGQGVLSGKYNKLSEFPSSDRRSRPEYKNFHGKQFEQNLKIVDALTAWSGRLNISIPKLALSWISWSIPNAVPIVGIKNIDQLDGALGMDDLAIPEEFYEELDAVSDSNITDN